MGVLLLVGTKKGLFLLRSDDGRRDWQLEGPLLEGWEVMHAMVDPRDGALYAAAQSWVYGGTVNRSTDLGKTWQRTEKIGLPEDTGLTLERVWHLEPARESEPDTLWLGAAPGALLRSDDKGKTWDAVRGLTQHPTREKWQPGAGGMCCHSIQFDPSNEGRAYAAISAAGTFRTDDGGETWQPVNKNVAADFYPDKYPELGQCVHKLHLHPERPERLWQQNHCGVYRSDDAGDNWERLDGNGLPSQFGFPIILHPRDPDVAYVIPEQSDEVHVTAEGRLGVYKTSDAGESWQLVANGLPEHAWVGVYREASAWDQLDPAGAYFGTQHGSIYVSPDEGDEWIEAASDLPPIYSIETAEWPS
jgi:photosystem II stability/assembly factor-like uncharacterized protein